MAMGLPKLGEKKICFDNCGNAIAENVEKKKKGESNCGNGIAEIGGENNSILFSFFFLTIGTHNFYNIFTTNSQ